MVVGWVRRWSGGRVPQQATTSHPPGECLAAHVRRHHAAAQEGCYPGVWRVGCWRGDGQWESAWLAPYAPVPVGGLAALQREIVRAGLTLGCVARNQLVRVLVRDITISSPQ